MQLDTLDTTGSGVVSLTTTSGNIQVGNGTGTAINNAGTGALTITSAGNIDVTEALTQAGAITLTANGGTKAGDIYGDSVITATSSALTLNADEIDDDGDATDAGALGVVSGSLVIDGDAGTKNVKNFFYVFDYHWLGRCRKQWRRSRANGDRKHFRHNRWRGYESD